MTWANEITKHISRQQIAEILEEHGFACYDSESTDKLREALRVNIEEGVIEIEEED